MAVAFDGHEELQADVARYAAYAGATEDMAEAMRRLRERGG